MFIFGPDHLIYSKIVFSKATSNILLQGIAVLSIIITTIGLGEYELTSDNSLELFLMYWSPTFRRLGQWILLARLGLIISSNYYRDIATVRIQIFIYLALLILILDCGSHYEPPIVFRLKGGKKVHPIFGIHWAVVLLFVIYLIYHICVKSLPDSISDDLLLK